MEEKTKQLLLTLLDKFVAICEQYHLQYYLAGGSVIGAVRHKGFIPWDDDIDVHMPRADYERLQLLPDSVWGENMRLASWRTIRNYPYDFLKLELNNTTIIERLPLGYIGGIYLDIFPLDFMSDDKKQIKSFEKQYVKLEKRYVRCTILNDNDCESIWELIGLKIARRLYNHKKWMEKWERLAMSFSEKQNKVCHSHGYFYDKGGMNAEWFGAGILMEFEGRKVLVPQDYDAYLKQVFGDYMKLPPVDSRKGHTFLYVNYDRRITPQEAEIIFEKLHKQLAYRISLKHEIKVILRKLHIIR